MQHDLWVQTCKPKYFKNLLIYDDFDAAPSLDFTENSSEQQSLLNEEVGGQ